MVLGQGSFLCWIKYTEIVSLQVNFNYLLVLLEREKGSFSLSIYSLLTLQYLNALHVCDTKYTGVDPGIRTGGAIKGGE